MRTFLEEEEEAPGFKYKCTPHKFYTNDRAEMQLHMLDKKLSHIEIIRNDTCFHCGEKLDADKEEGIQYRHRITGKSVHKDCRKKLHDELVNAATENGN